MIELFRVLHSKRNKMSVHRTPPVRRKQSPPASCLDHAVIMAFKMQKAVVHGSHRVIRVQEAFAGLLY